MMKVFFIRFYLKLILLFIGLSMPLILHSQDSLRAPSNFLQKLLFYDTTKAFRFKVLPVLTYSPETRLGFGAGFIFNWDNKRATPGTNSSLAQSFFIYTQNEQIDWASLFEIFSNENIVYVSGKVGYLKFPQYYFGVGNDLLNENKEQFSFQQFYIDLRARYKVFKKIYLGLDYYINTNYDLQWQEGSKFENDPELVGTEGYLISGLGPEIAYDSRDYPFTPTKGAFYSVSMLVFGEVIGSEYNYNYYQVDLRQFIPINKKKEWILALQFYGLFAKGEVPFNRLPALGNSYQMRGYYSGSFRDNNYITLQAEWRMPIWKMISLRTWLATGQVAENFDQFEWTGFKANFGLGLRVQFDQRSKSNIRLDQGFGEDTRGFYLKINEAF